MWVELRPQKGMLQVLLVPVTMTIFGNRIFAGVVKFRWALTHDWCLIRRRKHKVETEPQRRGHVNTEAGMGVMQPQAKGRLGPPGAGRSRKDPPLGPLEGAGPCPHPDLR